MDYQKPFFLPVTTEVYRWYRELGKEWELRVYGKRFNENQFSQGREVTVARGYNTPDRFTGIVSQEPVQGSLDDILSKVSFKKIIPIAKTKKGAKEIISSLIEGEKYIAFKIEKRFLL
ncbi:hypothetical protein ACFL0E_00230 [Nanoarchaeota archaeon]